MFKLAQISDVHLAPLPKPSVLELCSKRITGYLNWILNRKDSHRPEYLSAVLSGMIGHSPDHLAITGDLVNLATRLEIRNAQKWQGDLAAKLGGAGHITTILGNHDAYVPGALASVLDQWRPYLGSDETAPVIAGDFPLLRKRDCVSIISCNSAEATLPFQATGYFRQDQATRLARLLEGEKGNFRVVLIHHTPMAGETAHHKRLIGAERFADCIRQSGAELILHGHTHLQTLYWLPGDEGWVPVVGVSATGNMPGGPKPAGGYNLFSIDGEKGNWKCELERYAVANDVETGQPVMQCIEVQKLA